MSIIAGLMKAGYRTEGQEEGREAERERIKEQLDQAGARYTIDPDGQVVIRRRRRAGRSRNRGASRQTAGPLGFGGKRKCRVSSAGTGPAEATTNTAARP